MVWRVALAAATAILLIAAPARAQTQPLAGMNHFSGDRSGYLDVRIPAPAKVSFDWRPERNTTFAIASEGFAAVMLRRIHASDGLDTLVAAARFDPRMLCPACESGESLIVGVKGIERQATTDFSWEIPAGDYRLYLLTDGRPADVKIAFPGRGGSRVLQPEHGVANPVPEAIPPLLGGLSASPFQSFARGDYLPAPGVHLWGGLAHVASTGNVEIEGCRHSGGEPITTVFAPGCPGGTSEEGISYSYLMTEGTVGAGFVADHAPGDWSVGGSVVAPGDVRGAGYASVVLPVRGDGTLLAPAAGAPATAPAPAPAPQAAERGRTRLLTRSARVRRGAAFVRISCTGRGECAGSIRLGSARPTAYAIAAGHTARIRVAVPRALARRVQRRGRAVVSVAVGDQRTRLALRRG